MTVTENAYASVRAGAEEAAQVLCKVFALNGDGHGLYNVRLQWAEDSGWSVSAQSGAYDSEAGDIDVIRWWANELGGDTHLAAVRSHEISGMRRSYRELSARVTISGVPVEIWNHVGVHEEPIGEPAADVTLPTAA